VPAVVKADRLEAPGGFLACSCQELLASSVRLSRRRDRAGIHLAIASNEGVESRRSRIYGGRDWVRLGAVELGLDCLRRYLQGLPVTERTDFERV
jgi:hypothetical protein